MDLFLGHVAAHYLPGGDGSWLATALAALTLYVTALTLWLRARRAEAAAGLPPGVGVTGMAVLRAQADPRIVVLMHEEHGPQEASRPHVVLLHGLGASAAFWRPVGLELGRRGVRCVVPDLLGFAGSMGLGTHFHLDDQAAAVVRLLERKASGPAVMVGHSCGAAVAVAVAQERPDLVRRLVLVAPAAFSDAAQARRQVGGRSWLARKTMSGSPVAGLLCGLMCLLRRPLTTLAPRMASRVSPDIPPDVARDAVAYVWPAYRDALVSVLDDRGLVQWLDEPPLPTTVVVADQDQTVLPDPLVSLLGPDVEVMHLSGTHGLPVERVPELAALITQERNATARRTL